jgi:phosphoserine phosphatase
MYAPTDGVAEFCASNKIDFAFVADDLTRDRVRLVAMDMDSTLITIECIDEIADMIGIKPQVANDHRCRNARRNRFSRESDAPCRVARRACRERAAARLR